MHSPDRKSPPDFPHLHDIGHFNERLMAAVARINKIRPYKLESLGQVEGHDILLLSPATPDAGKANILTAGGFHGEEPAGPWGILEYLETATEEQLLSVNHSFLPLVNPTGFIEGRRHNAYDENPNSGFAPQLLTGEPVPEGEDKLSAEGEILFRHFARLCALARDGFMSQHEDEEFSDFYIYINEAEEQPAAFGRKMLDTATKHFTLMQDGGTGSIAGKPVKGGIWHNDVDDSCEGLMYLNGVRRTVTSETPGQMQASRRVACNLELARTFVAFTAQEFRPAPAAKKKPSGPKM